VTDLPLNGRNVLSLVSLVPGVVPQGGTSGNLTGQNVFSAGNFAIGGGTANQSSTLIDGAPVNILYGNATILIPDQDFVKEFRVQTSNNTAEYGMYTGGVINIATKNGTNQFHGTVYEFVRNTVLNANDWFANFNKTGKQPFHQNQFGANLGGPLWKNKIFFFADYQGFRQAYGNPYTGTVPTAAELMGDFSAIPGLTIYDPLTTCGYNGNPACVSGQAPRQQFAFNKIPVNRIAMNPTPTGPHPPAPGTLTPIITFPPSHRRVAITTRLTSAPTNSLDLKTRLLNGTHSGNPRISEPIITIMACWVVILLRPSSLPASNSHWVRRIS
jgi:hypothetical protein